MTRIDFIEAQQQTRVQSWFYGTHMSFDLASSTNGSSIRRCHWFRKTRLKVITSFRSVGIEFVSQLNQRHGALHDRIRRNLGCVLRKPWNTEQCNQQYSKTGGELGHKVSWEEHCHDIGWNQTAIWLPSDKSMEMCDLYPRWRDEARPLPALRHRGR